MLLANLHINFVIEVIMVHCIIFLFNLLVKITSDCCLSPCEMISLSFSFIWCLAGLSTNIHAEYNNYQNIFAVEILESFSLCIVGQVLGIHRKLTGIEGLL